MPKRFLLAATVAVALAVPTSAFAGTRSMTIKVPKSITEGQTFGAYYTGDTGPGEQATGGFIITARLYKGGGSCPANAALGPHDTTADIDSGNLFGAGAFSAADQLRVYDSGKWRVCGYLTENGNANVNDLLYSKKITVKSSRKFNSAKLPKLKDGTWTAATAQTAGGNPDASISFVVAGGNVVSAVATGIPNIACYAEFSVTTPVTPAATSTTAITGSNPVFNSVIVAAFNAPPNQELHVDGGTYSSRTFYGTVSAQSPDGSCVGSFAFKATRAK